MTPADRDFYRQESLTYRGLWNLPLSADNAATITLRLLAAAGEPRIPVVVSPGAEWHASYADRIEYIAGEVTPQVVIHEVAHVIQIRNGGEYEPDHDDTMWCLVALVGEILAEVL
jgi:hypothetical protein